MNYYNPYFYTMDYFYNLDRIIREELDKGKDIAIYPFGKNGMQAKEIL